MTKSSVVAPVTPVTLHFTRDFHEDLKMLKAERVLEDGMKCSMERFLIETLLNAFAERRQRLKKPSRLRSNY